MKSKKQSDDSSTTSSRTSRRRFAKAVATTIVAAPLASKFAQAQKSTGTRETTAPPNPQSAAPQQQKPSPLTEAYAEVARARFGDQLTPEQFEQVKKDLEANVQAAERLRAVKLKNEDEPDFVFSAE
jgi:hypothetical protein